MKPLLGLVLAAALVASSPLGAQEHPPLGFTLGRLEQTTPCGGACADFIVARGEVGHASSLRYLFARKLAGDRDIPVLLASPGGYAFGAQALGRVWRKLGVTVIVTSATPTCGPGASPARACAPEDRAHGVQTFRLSAGRTDCASACPMMLAGATTRLAGPGARIGVHRGWFDEDTTLGRAALATGSDQETIARDTAQEMAAFFTEMGVDAALARRSLATSSDRMDWLSARDAQAYRIFNAEWANAALSPALREAMAAAERRRR